MGRISLTGRMGLFSQNLAAVLSWWVIGGVAALNPWSYIWRAANTPAPARLRYEPPGLEMYPQAWVQPRALSHLTPVVAQCGEAQVLVTVKRDLFGTGRLIQIADLSLGPTGCQPTSFNAAEDTVIFDVGLHECGSVLQMTPEFLVYSINLYYKPVPSSNVVIVRTSPVEVPIECHYPRRNNVSSNAIKPTWIPFTSTISAEEKLSFSLRLMNDDWSAERTSNGYQLGEVMHVQAEVNTENHTPLRLFVDSCVASPSPGADSTTQYPIIDYKGCLIDGRLDSSSTFLLPRLRDDLLRFTVDVFRFSEDPKDLIYITCHLKVAAALEAPDQENKACSFNQASKSWIPVEGTPAICSCCETRNCVQSTRQSNRNGLWDRWGRRLGRDVATRKDKPKEADADLMLGPILILDSYLTSRSLAEHQNTMDPSADHGLFQTPWMLVGLILVVLATSLTLTTLTILCTRKKHSGSR